MTISTLHLGRSPNGSALSGRRWSL